jgi:hypothetical protein
MFVPPTPPNVGSSLVAKMLEIGSQIFTLPFTYLSIGNNMYYVGTFVCIFLLYKFVKHMIAMLPMQGSRVERNFMTERRAKAIQKIKWEVTAASTAVSSNVIVA